jgi:hypothetical protein
LHNPQKYNLWVRSDSPTISSFALKVAKTRKKKEKKTPPLSVSGMHVITDKSLSPRDVSPDSGVFPSHVLPKAKSAIGKDKLTCFTL